MPTTDKIKRAFTWLRKSLEITEKTNLPGTIDGEIRPILDAYGWDLLQLPEQARLVTAGPTLVTRLAPVPAGEAHLFISCDLVHSDGAATHAIWIQLRAADGTESVVMKVGDPLLRADSVPASMGRPILVPAGARLFGQSLDSIPIATTFVIRGHFIRLKVGEYVQGSPYG